MVGQRVLLPLLVVAFALLGPGQALAAPQWRVPDPALLPAGGAPDVTADGQGNSAAAWYSAGHIYVAQRPFGGPWASADDLQPDGQAAGQDPKVAALPDGELVAAWVVGSVVQGATKPPGGDWSAPTDLSSSCCVGLEDAVAGADGSALVYWTSGDGSDQTSVKPAGTDSFGPAQDLSLRNQPTKVALAPDGSAVAAAPDDCGIDVTLPCIRAQIRPAGGTWGTPELVSDTQAPPSGIGVAARTGSPAFTVAWGDSDGTVWSADRSTAPAGSWSPANPVPGIVPGTDVPPAGCVSGSFGCFDLAGRGDGLAAVWQAGTEVAGSVRSGGGAWSDREAVGSAGTAANTSDADIAVAIAADGTPITGWTAGSGGVGAVLRGAHRSGAGTWQQQDLGTPSGGEAGLSLGDVAADGLGDGLAGFSDPAGSQVVGFDGAGPRVSASVPATGTAGQTLPFSAAADDNWSGIASISWLFGDGGTASGTPVGHAYAGAGTFTATATATDGVGNASQSSGTTAVTAAPTPTPTPTPDACGAGDRDLDGIGDTCDKNDGSRKPVPFKTVNATVVSGEVFVKLPAGAARASRKAPKGFVRLQGAETIPVRSTLDTAHGRVLLRSASDTRNHVQIGQFYRGRFVVRQFRKPPSRRGRRSTKLITELRLTGSSFAKACKTSTAKATASARRRSKKRVRRLFGDGKGAFRTKGRSAAATVRGTRWGVQDRCDGTLVTVQRGRVSVRDLVKRKTVLVKAGHTYLARRR